MRVNDDVFNQVRYVLLLCIVPAWYAVVCIHCRNYGNFAESYRLARGSNNHTPNKHTHNASPDRPYLFATRSTRLSAVRPSASTSNSGVAPSGRSSGRDFLGRYIKRDRWAVQEGKEGFIVEATASWYLLIPLDSGINSIPNVSPC